MIFSLPTDILPETALVYVLAFARIGTAMMVLPGLGEMSVSARIRLVMAIAVTAVLAPVIAETYPALPLGVGAMAASMIGEIGIGLFIGLTARMFMSALQVAGTIIAFQTGLAFAMNMDPTQGIQGAIVGTYLAVLGTAMIFVTDLHHLMLIGLRDSYTLFPPLGAFPTADFLAVAVDTMASAFTLGVKLAAPFIVFSLVFYSGIGILSKLIPQVQIFFVAMPANILIGFIIMFMMVSSIMLYFLEHFEAVLLRFIIQDREAAHTMSDQPDQSEKTEDASSKKLEEAHKKGDVAKSQEVSAWFGMIGIGIIVALFMGPMAAQLAAPLSTFIVEPHAYDMDGGNVLRIIQQLGIAVVAALGLPMLVLVVMAVAGNLVQHKPVFSAENMKPKFSKISPLAGLKRIFGPQGMMNFFKGLAKLVIVSLIAFWVVWPERDMLGMLMRVDLAVVPGVLQEKVLKLIGGVIAIMTVIAGIDFAFQKAQWAKKQRMTQKEVKDEFKQMEGDPAVKAKLRQIRHERGRKRMMAQVPEASVIVTNPTHYSVALKYEEGMAAPVCVAKGVDRMAFKIREIAKEHDIPLVENVPLARALHATVEVDDEVPPEHYKAVAQVIGYVMRLKGKMRRGSARA